MDALSHLRQSIPQRVVVLGAGSSYYDAAASNTEADFGNFLGAGLAEDYHFTNSTRWLVIGRIRREVRNNCYLAGLVSKFPEALGNVTLRSRTSSKQYNTAKDAFWYRFAKRVTNAGDSLRSVENILRGEMLVGGELFLIKLPGGKLQLVPSEFCGSPAGLSTEPAANGQREVNGIIYAGDGTPRAYRFGKIASAGGIAFTDTSLVEARHVIHVFDKDRVHMGRGLPWLLPCLRPAHDLYEITRAKTKQIKDVSSIFGTIEKAGSAEFLQGLDAPEPGIDGGAAPEAGSAAADPVKKEPVKVEIRPGMFIGLEPGEKLNVLSSKYEAQDYKELIFLMLHAISSPLGLPVELWFSGLGDVNYSGFKGLGTQWNARRRFLLAFFEEKFLDPLHEWRLSLAEAIGELPANPDGDVDLIDWRWRRTAVLDEEKEGKANQVRLQSGELSHVDIWEDRGLYPEEVLAMRREFWIKLQIAAGELEEGGDYSAVKVPIGFLLRSEMPGTVTYPYLPDGTGTGEDIDPETGEPTAKAEPATPEEEVAARIAGQRAARLRANGKRVSAKAK